MFNRNLLKTIKRRSVSTNSEMIHVHTYSGDQWVHQQPTNKIKTQKPKKAEIVNYHLRFLKGNT